MWGISGVLKNQMVRWISLEEAPDDEHGHGGLVWSQIW